MTARATPAQDLPADDYAAVCALFDGLAEPRRHAPLLAGLEDDDDPVAANAALLARWAGLTPDRFREVTAPDHARALVAASRTVLTDPTGIEAGFDVATPPDADWRPGGRGLAFAYGFHPCPFGETIIATTGGRLAALGFVDGDDRPAALADMVRRWPQAVFTADQAGTAELGRRAFEPDGWTAGTPLPLVLLGTPFEVSVWKILLKIPFGRATTYSAIADHLHRPTAARAVGSAVGSNTISFVIPCHRVLGRSGALTGYYWGITRKQVMLAWEAGHSRR